MSVLVKVMLLTNVEDGVNAASLMGKLVNCCRVRKDFSSLTQQERLTYMQMLFSSSPRTQTSHANDALVKKYRTHTKFCSTLHNIQESVFSKFIDYPSFVSTENLLSQIDYSVIFMNWDWTALHQKALQISSPVW